ncbi:FAD-dependent oxidoreductase [Paenibacillus sp. PR3]|uniref:FAD-dependent oxidoreductase n=1 Tax=Paenibacillus terricola TaxID=2763503 RepID=A0ABR8N4K3_9BACL|nr:FAD-dependent oxidoreductase [Paenibacillus terricola]MBD3922471.1 FAD-dependent oxidoreductase [Paenibacillus terricola]
MTDNGMVIVGAGEAGARAAVELRAQGYDGTITLIGDERHFPYERPPLSKQQLCEAEPPTPAVILAQEKLDALRIRLLSGDAASRIDRSRHIVQLASGREVPYSKLLLATGANPRRLTVQGDASEELHYLRKFDDAIAIRDKMKPGARVAVIGGGFIGLETAASAITRGCDVTLIEVGPRILMRGVPQQIAEMVEASHRKAGVSFAIGVMIERIDRDGEGFVVKLVDGSVIGCDLIIAGIGAVPETTLAEDSGLAIENGIQVDSHLMTSDPDIYAAGDCCSFPNPMYSNRRIRLEAWRNAQDQGTQAAINMLGITPVPYAALPWFWSDQYDQTLQVAGLADGASSTIERDLDEAGKLFFHLAEDGRLLSVSGMGPTGAFSKEMRLAEMLAEKQARIDAALLADPAVKLKALLRELD